MNYNFTLTTYYVFIHMIRRHLNSYQYSRARDSYIRDPCCHSYLHTPTYKAMNYISQRELTESKQSNSSKFRNGGSASGASASLLQSHNADLNNPTNGNANSSAGGVKKRKHFVPAGTASGNMPVGDVTIKTEGM